MKLRLFSIIVIVLLFSLSFSFAYDCSELVDDVIGVEVPAALPYSNERFNIYINDSDEAFIIVEGRNITTAGCYVLTEPTYNVRIDSWETIELIANSSNVVDVLDDLIDEKTVILEGATFFKEVKAVFTEMMIKVFSWFV